MRSLLTSVFAIAEPIAGLLFAIAQPIAGLLFAIAQPIAGLLFAIAGAALLRPGAQTRVQPWTR
ncbi:hypothetical protein BH18ACT15_BH18ACT15_10420 [soil metagenome]